MAATCEEQLLHPVQQLLSRVEAELDEVGDPALWGLGGGEVDAVLVGLERVVSRVRARSLTLVAEGRRRNRASAVGATSATVWLAQLLHVSPAAASRLDAQSRVLDDAAVDPVTEPLVADARTGMCGIEQAVVAADAVADLPEDLSAQERSACVASMREAAARFDPVQVRRLGGHLLDVVDPDRAQQLLARRLAREEAQATARRELVVGTPDGGLVRGRFTLPTADAAVVTAALRPLAAPKPAAGGVGPDPWTDPVAARSAGATRDERSHGQRMADALVELCTRSLTQGDLPAGGGERPQLVVTVAVDHLRELLTGTGQLLDGTDLSPATLRRLACDAAVLPAVLGGAGQPLDIGRETRVVPTGLRRALMLRDRGCAFPSCDRPPDWTDAHHIRHWADGGETKLDNLVLLCGHHHRYTHSDSGWTVRIRPDDGHPEWLPPPWLDPTRHPVPGRPRWSG